MQTTTEKLTKTRNSLINHVARGYMMSCNRSYQLIDKYNDLKKIAQKEKIWEDYCLNYGSCKTHDAYDFFA